MEDITPATALVFLENNTRNRKITRSRVALYAKDMEQGKWQNNGDAIRFSEAGDLIDGQHRLHAVIKSGLTFQDAIVIRGIADGAMKTIDSGFSRTNSAVMSMEFGIPSRLSLLISSAISYRLNYEAGRAINTTTGLSTSTIMEYYKLNMSDADEIAGVVDLYPKARCVISKSRLVGLFMILYFAGSRTEKRKALIDGFLQRTMLGNNLAMGTTEYSLNTVLTRNKSATAKYSTDYIMKMSIRAWNSIQRGYGSVSESNIRPRADAGHPVVIPNLKIKEDVK